MHPVAIVTGTRKGLGRYVAERLIAAGWTVAGCSRRAPDWQHERFRHFTLDVGDEGAVVHMVRDLIREFGHVDALINNAGIASMNHALLTPASTVRAIFETNVFGAFFFTREVAKGMARRKTGRIVNISSIAVALHLEGEAVYAASKAAIESVTRTMARELGGSGITVNAVAPGPVDTHLIQLVPEASLKALIARQAIQRLGTPEDVWNVIEFLLKPESGFVTGQVIYLGGIRG